MLNGALRDFTLLLLIYDVTSNRRNGCLYEQQWGDGAGLKRLKHCAPYPLVTEIESGFWRTTPYAHHWLRNFRDTNLLIPQWWERVGAPR
jgi:hypothetical protein